jgi:hypothetical protein
MSQLQKFLLLEKSKRTTLKGLDIGAIMETPIIIENFTDCGVNIGKIVTRILNHAPVGCLDNLKQVRILDNDANKNGFACYLKEEREIRLFAQALVGWQPSILKKTYLFPYITVGLALGHEIDHHVNREKNLINKEHSAQNNALRYIYPSLGMFKPIVKILMFFSSFYHSCSK